MVRVLWEGVGTCLERRTRTTLSYAPFEMMLRVPGCLQLWDVGCSKWPLCEGMKPHDVCPFTHTQLDGLDRETRDCL